MTAEQHFHIESLDRFTAELAAAGFELTAGSNPSRWTGAIHPAFTTLTDAETMDIVIAPGWPFQPPALLVQGLSTNHSTLGGFVCLWREGDFSRRWTTVEGLFSRIEEWCGNAEHGWEDDQLAQDAFLNFSPSDGLVATFNLPQLGIRTSGWGDCHAIVNPGPLRVDISPGRRSWANQLRGLWFHVGELSTPPPRRFSEVPPRLSRPQARNLKKALDERGRSEPLLPSGGVDFILFCWERYARTDLLVMICKGTGDEMDAIAVQAGPNDENSLILRAGPDAPALRTRKVALFGAGALGGHTATLLAESGVGFLDIVDPDVLLPGNVVRHVAGHNLVGAPKVHAVKSAIANHAPWTEVTGFTEYPRTPSQIRERMGSADIVIDTTGNEALALSLATLLEGTGMPLISGALYRGGRIGRVQRQALPSDTPIHQRGDLKRYPPIPAGDAREEFATSQLGCSAPVNNAPPAAVSACASLIVQSAIDALTGRFELADEVLDVYQAIPSPVFDRTGRVVPDTA